MNEQTNKLSTFKKIISIVLIALILLLYITTFVLSLMNNHYTKAFFDAALFATFFIPIMLYLILWLAKVIKNYSKKDN